MFEFSLDKIIVICIVAAFAIGPKRMPQYAAQLARLAKQLRGLTDSAQKRVRDELGPEYEDVDWKQLDPRRYDPRQIIRESLLGDESSQQQNGNRLPNPFRDDAKDR